MTEKAIRSLVSGLPYAEKEDLVATLLGEWELWEGDETSFKQYALNWEKWWPQRKRDEERLAAYETGEIYGVAGLYPPSEYGEPLGPLGGIF